MSHLWPVADRIAVQRLKTAEDVDIVPGDEPAGEWLGVYVNAATHKPYTPHHEDERLFVFSDTPKYMLAKGGEGAGKSVAGIVKTLNRLRRGMSGIMVSPDFEHFKKSLWKEFRRWCPWEQVIKEQQYRARFGWEPTKPFTLTFVNGAELICGGIEEPGAWEGPNVHFAYFDEARRHKTPDALKVLAGRVRLEGPEGEPPQLYLTTTPRKHWLFEFFGPLEADGPDANAEFKSKSLTVTLRLADNAANLSQGYEQDRRAVLTESEARVLMDAEWEDIEDATRFLESILWWDACSEDLPALDTRTPLALAADAAVTGDTFGVVGVSLHPADSSRVAVRYVRAWEPKGQPLDFDEIEEELVKFCKDFNVLQIAYDPYQLHQMMTGLDKRGIVPTAPFHQGAERLTADKNLLDLITQKRISHGSDPLLRKHLDNADKKVGEERKLRIVKRSASLKIDLAVALSMAAARVLELPVTSVSDLERNLFSRLGGRRV